MPAISKIMLLSGRGLKYRKIRVAFAGQEVKSMTIQEHRVGSGRRATDRRENGSSIISGYVEYSGPDRRSRQDRRAITDRRR